MPDVTPTDYLELRELAAGHLPPAPQAGRRRIYADAVGVLQSVGAAAPVAPLVPEGGASDAASVTGSGAPVDPDDEGGNETQELAPNDFGPFTGTFKIAFDGQETPDINVEVTTLDEVVVLLEALSTIGAGNITENSGNTGTDPLVDVDCYLSFEFIGDLAATDVALMTVTDLAVLSDGTPVAPEDFALAVDDEGVPVTAGTPADPTDGLLYADTDTGKLYVYAGSWQEVSAAAALAAADAAGVAAGAAAALTSHAEDVAPHAEVGFQTAGEVASAVSLHADLTVIHEISETASAIANGVLAAHLAADGPHQIFSGQSDPSAGAGVVAAEGCLYLRSDAGVGELWLKVGAGDTAWEQVTTS